MKEKRAIINGIITFLSSAFLAFGLYNVHSLSGVTEGGVLAAFLGAIFVGLGAGICVRIGGAPGGDDALAMSISHITGWKIQWVYLLSDMIVLGLSLSYIPVRRIGYSVATVLLSGQLIGVVQNFPHDFSGRKKSRK